MQTPYDVSHAPCFPHNRRAPYGISIPRCSQEVTIVTPGISRDSESQIECFSCNPETRQALDIPRRDHVVAFHGPKLDSAPSLAAPPCTLAAIRKTKGASISTKAVSGENTSQLTTCHMGFSGKRAYRHTYHSLPATHGPSSSSSSSSSSPPR